MVHVQVTWTWRLQARFDENQRLLADLQARCKPLPVERSRPSRALSGSLEQMLTDMMIKQVTAENLYLT